ncbi:unnamed protein product [Parascedosporium putredinis]|uniref:Allergen n=1 Tax=Parascedosporium putredinis TaxID=1442378 RepID=A0A9P1H114_9PEZI|nr:unnamed protein product [Parascedosporium putredinis]CAI7992342.1 unnamed protein product [Parascedosporium putredinis]
MEKAKRAVAEFISRDGKHTTIVDQDVRKAVTEEHIRPHQHEEITTAIDKEVHQHHHHTTVQPLEAKARLAEEHTYNTMPVEHRTFEHGNEGELRAALDRDAARFKDHVVTHEATHSTSTAPTVTGERVHHHVHEHIQPVVQKETIAPQVIHTTVPIHETHHAAPVFHETTTLPAKTLEEFTSQTGATLTARSAAKIKEFEGCPKYETTGLHSGVDGIGASTSATGTSKEIGSQRKAERANERLAEKRLSR